MTTLDLSVLKLAFTRHVLDEITRADRTLTREEQALVERVAPTSALRLHGLLDLVGQPTAAFHRARAEALERLPEELPLAEKLELVTAFLEACVVDGRIDRDEGSLMYLSSRLLGVTSVQFDAHLDSLTDHVGAVELDAPLDE